MEKLMRSVAVVVLMLIGYGLASAADYTVTVGNTKDIYCTASAPAGGWITHALFELVEASDAEYLGIAYNTSDCRGTLYGLKAKSNIRIQVTYAYSYRGSYDNNIHVGSSSYYATVTVKNPGGATSFKFREGSNIDMRPGQTVTIHADYTPSGTRSPLNWGFLDLMGTPWNFDGKAIDDGTAFEVTSKKVGNVKVIAFFPGNQESLKIIEVTCTEDAPVEEPTSITLTAENITLDVGASRTLKAKMLPSNSYSTLVWESSDTNVATVDQSGEVSGVAHGTANITVRTSNNLSAVATVKVVPVAISFTVEPQISIPLGYVFAVTPSVVPAEANIALRWSSSDTSVASVSSTGEIKAKDIGTAIIKVNCANLNMEKEIQVRVTHPAEGLDIQNVRLRVQHLKCLFNLSIIKR